MPEEGPLPPFWEDQQVVGGEINLLDLAARLVRRWPFVAVMALGGGIVAVVISFSLTPKFVSKAVFLPPTQQIASTENPFAALLKTPSTAVYSGLLLSETVLGNVVEHSDLQRLLKSKDAQDARVKLRQITSVSTDSSGFVTIAVTHQDPQLARNIANNFLQALAELNDRMSISAASQQRHLYQTELQHERDALENAEGDLKKAEEASGVVLPQNQTQAALFAIDTIRSQIRTQQVRLSALLQSQTDQSPEVVVLRSEIEALEAQLHRLESGGTSAAGEAMTASRAPSVNLQFVQLEREVKYHQVLFDLMAKQFESAKLEESSAAPGVQVVDYPEVSLRKAWPSRSLFAIVGAFVGGLVALTIIFIKDRWTVLGADTKKSYSLRALGQALVRPVFRP